MDTESLVTKFFQVVDADLSTYRPETTHEEKIALYSQGVAVLSKVNHTVEWCSEEEPLTEAQVNSFKLKNREGKSLFMSRTVNNENTLPYEVPKTYDVFLETSYDIYTNYRMTLDYLDNKNLCPRDSKKCVSMIEGCNNILSWSNASILLHHLLHENAGLADGKYIYTFGSPVLVAHPKTNVCINLYHEDDWILGLVGALYKIDLNGVTKNVVHNFVVDSECVKLVVFSRSMFPDASIDPHRNYYYFL
jgi:hypothetical protein